ncbi:PDDEXK family nuclease [Solicola gregarius]|uniref:DUF559 domain-containing protein n=1 Tax=Solicola gregarius TaxID=2908642 RepID=A0AA46TND6_9ACTN|nr:hypothetical protein [Solicola gregarius]UYM07553.1 hypothetical protein L0C25_10920 [Solicola gregarius]
MNLTRTERIDDPPGWTQIERDQRRVVTSAQASIAFGKPFVINQLHKHRWQRPCRGVIVVHNGPILESERRMVALLSGPPRSVLGGLTALREDGFAGFESVDARPRIIVPAGARRPSNRDVDVHWSEHLGDDDVHPLQVPVRTRPARSALNEAAWSRPPRLARALILSVVQQGLARPDDLIARLATWPNGQHHGLIMESTLDAAGGTQSLPEGDFVRICTRQGAPPPSQQVVRRRPDGRLFVDIEWRQHDVAVEIHGIPHMRVLNWEADLMRANEIVIAGPRLLIFSSYAVRHEPDRVWDQVCRALRLGGWRG